MAESSGFIDTVERFSSRALTFAIVFIDHIRRVRQSYQERKRSKVKFIRRFYVFFMSMRVEAFVVVLTKSSNKRKYRHLRRKQKCAICQNRSGLKWWNPFGS